MPRGILRQSKILIYEISQRKIAQILKFRSELNFTLQNSASLNFLPKLNLMPQNSIARILRFKILAL
nr:hypothetical protein [uncultured Campylobacter sp.]